jgi:kinesin family protein 11
VYRNDTASNLFGLRQANKALQEQGTREDIPTGTTPRKRAWEYDDDWERTQDRDTILREWRQSQQHRSKRLRLRSRSASVESRHGSEIDIRASIRSKPVSEDDFDDGADGDKTIRGEPGVTNGDGSTIGSGPRLGVPAVKQASDTLTGSTSSSVSVPTSASASASSSSSAPGLPRSTALQSAAVRSGAVGVGKLNGLAKNQYTTRGGSVSSNKGAPLADRNLVSRIRKAR